MKKQISKGNQLALTKFLNQQDCNKLPPESAAPTSGKEALSGTTPPNSTVSLPSVQASRKLTRYYQRIFLNLVLLLKQYCCQQIRLNLVLLVKILHLNLVLFVKRYCLVRNCQ